MTEKFQELRDKAKKNIHLADHMLTITYPLVKDTKLLLAILENIFLAYYNGMSSVLYYDRLFKKIPNFQETYEGKYYMFKDKTIRKHGIDKKHAELMQEIKELIQEHKKSPVTFERKDKFVICNDKYHIKTISIEQLNSFLSKAKLFIHEIDNIVSKNERIFG